MSRLKRAYEIFEDFFAGGMLFIGLSLIFINVILRYFWGKPQSLLDEFSVYFVVWGTLAGIAVALRNDHHIKVDMLYNVLPLKSKKVVSIFSNCLGLSFALFYTIFGTQLVNNYIISGQRSADSQFPLWIVNLIMPISGLLFSVRFLERIYNIFKDGGRYWLAQQDRGGQH